MKPNVNPRAMRRAFAKELFAGLRIVWPILSEHIQINARVAELADAPDLGKRNHRFQDITFHFKKEQNYEREMRFFAKGHPFTRGE